MTWSPDTSFTAGDALALDVECVERWVAMVVADGDSDAALLASLVTRLRSAADVLAEHLFATSEPVRERVSGCGCGSAAPRRAPHRPAHSRKQGPGCDSGGRPQGVPSGSKRSAPEAPASTSQGKPRADSAKGSFHE